MKGFKGVLLISFLSALVGLFTGCASIQSVSLTPIPAKKGRKVESMTSKMIIFGMNFNNDFVDEMVSDLKRQCKDGMVTGILTKDEVIDYFLMIVHARKITATGYCQQGQDVAKVP